MALSVGRRTLTAILTEGATVSAGALASESGTLRGPPPQLDPARLTLTDQATANTPGVDTRTAVVSDGGTPVTVTASLTVAAVNAAPTLAANAVSGTEDTTLTCPAADFTGAAADGRARPSRASQWRPCRRRVGGNSPVPT